MLYMMIRRSITAAVALGLLAPAAVAAAEGTGTDLSITQLIAALFWKLGLLLAAAYALTYALRMAAARLGPRRAAPEEAERDTPAAVRSNFFGRLAGAVVDEDDTGE